MFTWLMLALAQIPLITFAVILIRAVRSHSRTAVGLSLVWIVPYVITMSVFATWVTNQR